MTSLNPSPLKNRAYATGCGSCAALHFENMLRKLRCALFTSQVQLRKLRCALLTFKARWRKLRCALAKSKVHLRILRCVFFCLPQLLRFIALRFSSSIESAQHWLYESETWCLRETETAILRRTERTMARSMCGVKFVDRTKMEI